MARNRMIKPEFWVDDKVARLTPMARLLFIGTWNFADDYGHLEASAERLRAQVFPYEPSLNTQGLVHEPSLNTQGLLDELTGLGLLIPYEVDGEQYFEIKNFLKHQTINRPSKPQIPARPTLSEPSVSPHAKEKQIEEKVIEEKVKEPKGCAFCATADQIASSKPYTLLQYYHDRYREIQGECPVVSKDKDLNQLKGLLLSLDVPKVTEAIDNLFASTDPWIVDDAYSIRRLVSEINALRRGPKNKSQPARAERRQAY